MINKLDPILWREKTVHTESTLHQISPYIGKLKSSIAKTIIKTYSNEGDIILDPFVGSGTIALESIIENRNIICYDINPYAILLTKAKLFHPENVETAEKILKRYLKKAKNNESKTDVLSVPDWVKNFYHPKTLIEIISLKDILINNNEYFLLGCLFGILHHQRPGFLSYPSSYSIPYLRYKKYPKETYPDMYEYRELEPRIINKIHRAYKRVPAINQKINIKCKQKDALKINLSKNSIDAIITSPPYMDTLDYYRDNRLRLYFLEKQEYLSESVSYVKNVDAYSCFMAKCFNTFTKILKPGKVGVIILGNIRKSQKIDTSDIVLNIIQKNTKLMVEDVVYDSIKRSYGTKRLDDTKREEVIIVFRKKK